MNLLRLRVSYQINADEVDEAIKRIQIKGYDRARHHLQEAIDNRVYEQTTELKYPLEGQIQATCEWLDANDR